MNRAQINDWLAVGNYYVCKDATEPLVVHIFRSDSSGQQNECSHANRTNYLIDYREGDELDISLLDGVVQKLTSSKVPTLVHCAVGLCRSPTVAVYLLVTIEGMHPYDAHQLVTRKIYEQRGEVCDVRYVPFNQIVKIWESRCSKNCSA